MVMHVVNQVFITCKMFLRHRISQALEKVIGAMPIGIVN